MFRCIDSGSVRRGSMHDAVGPGSRASSIPRHSDAASSISSLFFVSAWERSEGRLQIAHSGVLELALRSQNLHQVFAMHARVVMGKFLGFRNIAIENCSGHMLVLGIDGIGIFH